jgi:hypothetical protein
MKRCVPILFSLLAIGCQDQSKVPQYASLGLIEVTGKVTLDGTPTAGLSVIFENPADKTFSHGTTDANGVFRLSFNSEKTGCTPGEKIVRITGKPVGEDDPDVEPAGVKIPARYNRQSELKVTVDSSHTYFEFQVTSK